MAKTKQKSPLEKMPGTEGFREAIMIPAPIVNRGARCMVLNNRRGPRGMQGVWEQGIVQGLRYENAFGSFRWSYDVVTDRPGFCADVRLTVGDAGVQAIKKGKA